MFIEAWWENVKKIVSPGKIKSRRVGNIDFKRPESEGMDWTKLAECD